MRTEPEFRNITRGGQTWRYNDAGSGPPVLLFHGFPDTPHSYAGIATELNDAGYRTIRPYLRGYHADTIVPGRGYDAHSIAEDAVGLLDALQIESAVLVGHDWGAMVVYGAAALVPERVKAIVPLGIPHPRTLKPRGALQAAAMLALSRHILYFQMPWCEAGIRRNDFAYVERLYRRWAPNWKGADREATVAWAKQAFSDPAVLSGALDWYRTMFRNTDRYLHLLRGSLDTRGLMIAGGKDFGGHLGPYKKSAALFELGAELVVMPEAGHWPHRENEPLFKETLIRFLGKTQRTGSHTRPKP